MGRHHALSEFLHLNAPVRAMGQSNISIWMFTGPGDRDFAVAAPSLWNSLPVKNRTARSIEDLKSLLKTHLFAQIKLEMYHSLCSYSLFYYILILSVFVILYCALKAQCIQFSTI